MDGICFEVSLMDIRKDKWMQSEQVSMAMSLIKSQFPQYSNRSDEELSAALYKKYGEKNGFSDPESFYQDITVERIDNPLSVYIPFHLCKKSDFSDMSQFY